MVFDYDQQYFNIDNPFINKQKYATLKKYGRYTRRLTISSTTDIKTLKGSVLHQQNILIRTPGPARHSLTLTNTHSPKSISLHDNEQSLTGKSTIATPSTIHESDEGIVENNSDDDEDADRSSNTIDDSNNYATILNKTNSLERFTDNF
ncbi:unnamed protein product, partial [Rotaria magnacalcarata]